MCPLPDLLCLNARQLDPQKLLTAETTIYNNFKQAKQMSPPVSDFAPINFNKREEGFSNEQLVRAVR
jgi:hypothetical protein